MEKQRRSVRTSTKEKDAKTGTVGEDTDQGENLFKCRNRDGPVRTSTKEKDAKTRTVGEDTDQGENEVA